MSLLSKDRENKDVKAVPSEITECNGECFGEYGSRIYCSTCKFRLACKNFTKQKRESLYRRYKGKHKGRGKFRKRDRY